MPIYEVQGPDGRIYEVEGPAGASEADIIRAVRRQYLMSPAAAPEGPKEGIGAALVGGTKRFLSTGRTGLGSVVDAEGAARAGVERGEALSEQYAPGADLEKVKQVYRERGLLPAAGEVLSQIPSAVAEQVPQIVATLGSAKAGAIAGAPLGPKGIIAGGLAGAVAPSLLQLYGANIERQAETQMERGEPLDIGRGRALAAAVPGAGLEVAATFIPFGRTLVGKLLGPEAAKLLGTPGGRKIAEEGLTRVLATGAAVGTATEIPTETIQQMLERYQAGLSLTSDDALAEYGQAAYGAALVGTPLGAAGRTYQRSAQRDEIAQEKATTEAAQQAEEARKRAEYEKTDEYALEVAAKYENARTQLAELEGQKRKAKKGSPTFDEDVAHNKAIGEKQKAIREESNFKDLAEQYKALGPRLASIELAPFTEAERAAPTADKLYMQSPQATIPGLDVAEDAEADAEIAVPERLMQQRQYLDRLLTDNQERMSAAAASADVNAIKTLQQQRSLIRADMGSIDERLKASGFVDTAGQAQQLQQDIARAQQQLQKLAGPGFDPDKAAKIIERIEKAQAQLAEFGGDQQGLDLGAPRKLSDPVAEARKFDTERTKRTMEERQDLLKQQQQTLPDDTPDLFAEQQREVAEDTFLQQYVYDQKLGFVPSMLERATTQAEPDVAVPKGVEFSERTQDIFNRIETVDKALDNAKDVKTRNSLLEERAQLSELASEDKNLIAVYNLRDQAEDALFEVEKLVDTIRNREQRLKGTLYAEDAAPAKQVQEAKEKYIRAVLQEAAALRRIRGEKGVTLDEALKAADKINTELDELVTRGQAVREMEEVITTPAQMRGTKIVSPAKTEMRDVRPLAERPFGKYRAALGTILEGVDKTRKELIAAKPVAPQRQASEIKMQFAETEAERVAEERGEKATTLSGELRRRAEFVRNKMGRIKGPLRPIARDALNKVADIIDSGKPTRDLLDATEAAVDVILSGQRPYERDVRAINDALAAMQETPAGQKDLFDTTTDRRRKDAELGVIRKTPEAFNKVPAVVQARAAVDRAREEAKKIEGTLKRKQSAARALQAIRNRIADLENKINATLERTKPAARSANSFFSLSPTFVKRMDAAELANATPERRAEYAAALQVEAQYQAMRQEYDEKFKREGAASRAAIAPLQETKAVLDKQEKAFAKRISDLEQLLKDPALVAAGKARAEAKTILAGKESDLQAQVDEQRADLQLAMDNAMAEVTAALDAVTLTTNPSVLAAKKTLDVSEEALNKTREQVGKAGGLEAAMQFANKYAEQVKDINNARDALADTMAKAQAEYDKTALIAKAYQDGMVKVELDALNRLEKRLAKVRTELGTASPEARAVQQEMAAQQKVLDVAEARQREARELAAKQQRQYDDRMTKGFGLPFARRVAGKVEGYQTPEKETVEEAKERFERYAADVARIEKGDKAQMTPRARGPVTRTQSAAPSEFRSRTEKVTPTEAKTTTGKKGVQKTEAPFVDPRSEEGRTGDLRTQTDRRLTEARGEAQRDVAMTSKEMQEANSLAELIRNKTPAQKRKEVAEAEAVARELDKELDKYSKDDGELYFSRGTPTKGLTAYELRNELRRAIGDEDTYVRKVAVYESVEDFVTEKKRYAGRIPTDAKGFVDPETGRAYLFADNIAAGEGMGILLHEVGVHIGFRNFFNKQQFTGIANTVRGWADAPASTLEGKIGRAAKKRAEEAGTPESQMDDELIAYAVEEAVKAGVEPAGTKGGAAVADWLRTIVDAFNKAIKALGLAPEKLKVGDLVNMAYGAAQLEIKGTWHGTGTLFKEFDHKFMGSGEGFQAFSWGTYRAQSKGIAESYRDKEATKKYEEWLQKPEIQRWAQAEAPALGGYTAADFERFAATGKVPQTLAGVPYSYAAAMGRALDRLKDAAVLDDMTLGPALSLKSIFKYHARELLGPRVGWTDLALALRKWSLNADFSALRMPFKAPLYKGMDSTDLYGVEGISKEERDAVRSVLLNLAYDEDVKKQKSEEAVRAAIQAAKDTAQIFTENSTSLRRKKALKELEVLAELKPEDFSYQQPTKPPIAKPTGVLMRTLHGRKEEEYLHWDLPFSQNPEPVKNSMVNAVDGLPAKNNRLFLDNIAAVTDDPEQITGEVFYEALKAAVGSGKKASELLNKFGVAGTKFLDYGSRGKPITNKSTYNYVDYGDKAEGATIVAADLEPIGPADDLLFSRKQKDDKQGLLERTAAIVSGVFPDHKPEFNANVPASFRNGVMPTASDTTFGDRISAFMLGMRTNAVDQYAAREALLKLGLEGKKLDEAAVTQSRIYMRLNSDANRFSHQALLDAPLALVKDEKGFFGVGVDEKRPGYAKVLETLRGVVGEVGNMEATEGLFQRMLQIERAETDGVGFEKMNMRKPPTAAEVRQFRADLAANPKLKAAFDKARTQYREFNNGMLDFVRDAGSFTDEEVATFKKGNYVPYYRLNENTGNIDVVVGGTSRTIGNIINQPQLKELVGGEKAFLGLSESVLQNTQMLTRIALQNLQARDVGFMIENLGLGKIIDGEGPANSIRFKIDGKKRWVKLDTDLFPKDIPAEILLQGLHGVKAAVPAALKMAGIPTRFLRGSIVRMPLYIIRSMIRDPLHAWFTTGQKFTPVVDSIKELTKMYRGESETELKLMRAGAVSSNVMTGDYNDAARTLRDLSAEGKPWNTIMATLDNAALRADSSTRAVLYDKYRQQGMSHFEAALGAAEVMNFSRRGTSSSLYMMSTLVPFFNAQIQGLDTIYRGIKGDTVFEKQLDVRNTLAKRAVFMTGITLAYALAMQDDEAYKNATPQERAMNWFLPLPFTDAALRVPIPFEIGILTKAIPELLYNAGFGDASSGDTVKGLKYVLGMSVPSIIPTAVKPFLEMETGYSFFRQGPIETLRDKQVAPEFRYRESTTELAKLMGKVGGVSPLQIENFVTNYASTAGILALSMFNPILRPFTSEERGEKVDRRITETPFFGSAFQPSTGRGLVDSVYADVEDWQQAAGTFKNLVTSGRTAEARAFADKQSRDIALSSTGGSFKNAMGQLAAVRRSIEANPNMTGSEKRERIEEIKKLQIKLASKIREMSAVE